MKRGTHGIAAESNVYGKFTDIVETINAVNIGLESGTQPGVIYASDNPKSAGYPRLFLIYYSRVKRDARHSDRECHYARSRH